MLETQKDNYIQHEGVELPNGEMRNPPKDKKGYKCLGVLLNYFVKNKEMKDMKVKVYY